MVKLLIIADDFTGALDTGVQFTKVGIKTKVLVNTELNLDQNSDVEVLVLNAETRHLEKKQAYDIIYRLIKTAEKTKIPFIYKKTDSALRGNIGSELAAVLNASEDSILSFIPAFPSMDRITKEGIQYINSVPVSESVFGRDPFEPVKYNSVKEIIQSQSAVCVNEIKENVCENQEIQKGISVYDATSEQALAEVANYLKKNGEYHLTAGCAGFAALLPELLELKGQPALSEQFFSRLIVICGSVNPITRRQLCYGETCGYERIQLTPEQKLNRQWLESENGKEMLDQIEQSIHTHICCMIDGNDSEKEGELDTETYAKKNKIDIHDLRMTISETFGLIAKALLQIEDEALMLISGGDTLLGMMRQIGENELLPVREIVAGRVLARPKWPGEEHYIATKSGGFGEENFLEQLVTEMQCSSA